MICYRCSNIIYSLLPDKAGWQISSKIPVFACENVLEIDLQSQTLTHKFAKYATQLLKIYPLRSVTKLPGHQKSVYATSNVL